MRQMLLSQRCQAGRVECLEKAVADHDEQIVFVVDVIRLPVPREEEPPREPFGFRRAKKSRRGLPVLATRDWSRRTTDVSWRHGMSVLVSELQAAKATDVSTTDDTLTVELAGKPVPKRART